MSGDYAGLIKDLLEKTQSRILLVVADGLGGLPMKPGGPTELEAARTPTSTPSPPPPPSACSSRWGPA